MNHDLKSSAKPSGEVKETSRYKINPADGKLDAKSQREDQDGRPLGRWFQRIAQGFNPGLFCRTISWSRTPIKIDSQTFL
jgi:hypothetical protein